MSKISLGGRRSCEDQVVTRREKRDNNQGEQFSNIPESVSLTGTSQSRVFSRPVNSPALHPFNETLLPWHLKIGQSIKTRIKDKCQGPFKLVLLYFYGCWEQKALMRIEDLLQDRCWPQGSDSDTPRRWWWPDLVCGPRQFVIQLHSPSSALRTIIIILELNRFVRFLIHPTLGRLNFEIWTPTHCL